MWTWKSVRLIANEALTTLELALHALHRAPAPQLRLRSSFELSASLFVSRQSALSLPHLGGRRHPFIAQARRLQPLRHLTRCSVERAPRNRRGIKLNTATPTS